MLIVLFTVVGLSLFAVGYYFGNQMGRAQFIRSYQANTRKAPPQR